MKLIKTIFIAAGIIIAVSCTSSLSTRMTEYVSDVESSCENWTAEDWEISCEEYEKLLAQNESEENEALLKDVLNAEI